MAGIIQNKGMAGGAGTLRKSGLIASVLTQAQKDAAAYRTLLASNGKMLAESDYQKVVAFASQLYATAGRVDFLMLRATQNMGSGSIAYSFHGKSCTLVNGSTWGADGITMGASAQISTPLPIPNYPSVGFAVQTFNGAVNQLHCGAFGSSGDRRLWIGGGQGLIIAGGNYGSNARVDYTHTADTLYATAWRMLGNLSSSSCTGGTSAGETVLINGIDSPGLINDHICGNDWNTYPTGSITINKASNAPNKTAFFMWSAGTGDKNAIYSAYRSSIGADLALPLSAADDAAAYRSLLASQGKVLLDADYQQIVSFASQLYAAVGRQDFLMLRSSQNMGTGTIAYTFHGQPCTLVNGATWGANEMTFTGVGVAVRRSTNILPTSPPATVIHVGTTRDNFSGNYGGQFGGRYGFLGLGIYSNMRWSAETGPDAVIYTGGTTTTRKFMCATASAEQAGSIYIDGTVSGSSAGGTNYSNISRDTITNMGGTGNNGTSVANATSFVLIASGDFSGQAATIRNAYRSTIGQGLGLP